jgi:hypothetical protein
MARGMCSRASGAFARLFAPVVAVATLAGAQTAAAAPRPCELQVAVTPSTLPPGQRSARVRVSPAHAGLHLATSLGEVGEAKREGSRALTADWTPARAQGSVLAIVAAVGGGDCGWTVLRAAGPSDPRGQEARGPATLVVVDPASARADKDEEVGVYVFATDELGEARGGAAPLLTASLGKAVRTEPIGPGVWRATWQVPAGEVGPAAVAAQFAGEAPVSAALTRVAGPASEILVEFERSRAAPGDPTPIVIDVRVRDALGNPAEGPIEVESDLGEVGTPERVEPGFYRVPLVVPSSLRGSRAILVVAKTEGVSATGSLQVGPGPAAALQVVPPGPVVGDGTTTAQLEVVVTDAFDNPAEEVPEGSATLGDFLPASRLGPGRWVLGYRPGRVLKDTGATLTVKAGAAAETVPVELIASRVSFAVGPKLGLGIAGGRLGLAVGAEGSAWTQLGKAQLGLVLEASWLSLSADETVDVGGAPAAYTSTQSWVPVLLSASWRMALGRRTMLWASLGGGFAWVSNRSQIAGQPEVSETGLAPAASAAVSFGVYAWRGFPFVELRATWVGDPNMNTLTGTLVPVYLLLGYRFDAG